MAGMWAVEESPSAVSEDSVEGRVAEDVPAVYRTATQGLTLGELVGLISEEHAPLVTYAGQPGAAALRARTVVDLHGAMVGRTVALMFERNDPEKPIVIGVIRGPAGWPLAVRPACVSVDADGERLVVDARKELVLRCGRASITLTRAGKVLIQGTYVSSQSSGVMRIKGGSVELN